MIPKIPINYYPLLNSGHTFEMRHKLDPCHMFYCTRSRYTISEISIYPEFNFRDNGDTDWDELHYTSYLVLQVNDSIDYNVLTSLN